MTTAAVAGAALLWFNPAGGGPADTADVGVVAERQADPTVFPDPRKFSRGFFVEGATGVIVPVGATDDVLSPGFALSLGLGYEIRRWIAVQAQASGSVSRYDDGVLTSELLQQYFYTAGPRFGIPIRRFLIALHAGAGLFQLSSNLLQVGGVAPNNRLFGFAWDAGLALDFHSLSRHFSGGVLATFIGMPQLENSGSVLVQAFLRYTL